MDFQAGDDYSIYLPPIETGHKDLFRISPLASIHHVRNGSDRVLERTYRENSVKLKVKSGLSYDEDDPSQENWRFEYSTEFFIQGPKEGLVRHFVDYEPVNSSRESAQSTISDRILQNWREEALETTPKKDMKKQPKY